MARAPHRLLGTAVALALATSPCAGGDLSDLHFGEALYHAYQGEFFDALERLDTELGQYYGLDDPSLDSLYPHIRNAEFDVGDFELNYRMHHRAGRAIKAVLEANVDEEIRNEAAYRLARIHFQKDQLPEALHALGRIEGKVPAAIQDDVEFLRANIYLATGRPTDAAAVLKPLQDSDDLAGFAAYNLGIALLQGGDQPGAIAQLDRAGQLRGTDVAEQAIRDKSNFVLGTLLFESADFERAGQSLDRVRLEGPFSNQALLRAGWAEASAEKFARALVPWNILVQREPTDAAVQEAMMSVPHAYAQLQVHGRAALLYGRALETYSQQIERVDASIDSIREGQFLNALVREEINQDKNWVVRLRTLPEAPETYYLTELMASHDFQTALQNYLDLADLRTRLAAWQTSFDAFEDVIGHRARYYEPLLPGLDAQFRDIDAQMRLRLEQRQHIADRLHAMLTAPRPDYLATADERTDVERLARLRQQLDGDTRPEALALRERIDRVQGTLTWRLRTEYHERLTEAYVHLDELNAHVDAMNAQYRAFVRARQAATHSYVGYDVQIDRLRQRVASALQRVELIQARQGHVIETAAINQLQARRERLVDLQTQARYAVADSYDRAARLQPAEGQP
ncbi:MAG TPA: tetratricopeptide repeat protein [Steroidobacteraceae bacterium]|nr:tetratricopeptide repeat protein [Steroidobacteraceae bacterium]